MPGNGMGYMAPQYPHSQGLALPGMSRPMNGSGVPGQNGYGDVRVKQEVDDVLRPRGGAVSSLLRLRAKVAKRQGEEDIKPRIEPNAAGLMPGDEIIDSDLDDSDREEGEDDDEEGDADIVFCVWDKVQRVKNKWKTTFKDGMIHINGRDYLFQKCSGSASTSALYACKLTRAASSNGDVSFQPPLVPGHLFIFQPVSCNSCTPPSMQHVIVCS